MRAGGTAAGSEGGKGQGRQSPSRWAGGSERQRPAGGAPQPFIMYPSEAAGDRRGAGAHVATWPRGAAAVVRRAGRQHAHPARSHGKRGRGTSSATIPSMLMGRSRGDDPSPPLPAYPSLASRPIPSDEACRAVPRRTVPAGRVAHASRAPLPCVRAPTPSSERSPGSNEIYTQVFVSG